MLRVAKIIRTEKRMVGARDSGEGRMGSYCSLGINFQIYKMKRIMGMDGGDDCITM